MFKIVLVSGQSMIPTLRHGERVLAWTPFARQFFKRGEIVTLSHVHLHLPTDTQSDAGFRTPIAGIQQEQPELFVKRIMGLPGDTVRIPVHQLSHHIPAAVDPQARRDGSDWVWRIPDDHVFIRGDGPYSTDSVVWGPVPFTQLRQVVLCRFPSFQRIS
ncbi:MAG: hypothetical protein BroJett015_19470 [Chloroflexota bacterium]|nr:signal peptidase I [Ardenticatenaceae bacterium]GIK56284.1 MAG: hypothetical protein BroJett015_19470 [Chloroflexota bacterium]